MPKVELNPNEKEFYRRECITNENKASDNWKKNYGLKLEVFDGMYKHLPSMSRCISGINAVEGLEFISKGGLEEPSRPKSKSIQEMSHKSFIDRPKSGHQFVGIGGLGVLADPLDRPRATETIYERDYCVAKNEFPEHIRGINMTKGGGSGPWRSPAQGTMAVIPTSWQFPPGIKQPEAFLLRSELRKLRLERDEKLRRADEEKTPIAFPDNKKVNRSYNPLQELTCVEKTTDKTILDVKTDKDSKTTTLEKKFFRPVRPCQSRSWAPVDNTAPKGWYKIDVGPGKLVTLPTQETVINTPQARLNVLKRRIDARSAVLKSL